MITQASETAKTLELAFEGTTSAAGSYQTATSCNILNGFNASGTGVFTLDTSLKIFAYYFPNYGTAGDKVRLRNTTDSTNVFEETTPGTFSIQELTIPASKDMEVNIYTNGRTDTIGCIIWCYIED